MLGLVHDRAELRHLGPDLVGDGAPLGAGGLAGVLRDGGGNEGGDDPSPALAGMGQGVPGQLPGWLADALTRRALDRRGGGLDAFARVRNHSLNPAQAGARLRAPSIGDRTRDFFVRQLTQLANAIRAHLGEFGIVVPKGVHNMGRLVAEADAADLPPETRMPLDLLVGQVQDTKTRIDAITADLRHAAKVGETARGLQTMPGIGPITASVLAATLSGVSAFRSARDLSAWLGLTQRPIRAGARNGWGRSRR